MATVEKDLVLKNKYGLHARPATLLAEVANGFKSKIAVVKDGQEVNAKSIFGLMMLAAEKGSTFHVKASGEDAAAAVAAMEKLIDQKFTEECLHPGCEEKSEGQTLRCAQHAPKGP
jgi:phosphocarrier protein HPr